MFPINLKKIKPAVISIFSFGVSCLFFTNNAHAQADTLQQYTQVTVAGGFTQNRTVPLWMWANQFGSVPLAGPSSSLLLRIARNYASQGEWVRNEKNTPAWDWGYALEARANMGYKIQGQLIDAHIKAMYKMVEVKLGRAKDVVGLTGDTLLSSGSFAISGNAPGVPSLNIRMPEYYRIPWFGGLLSFKANFANGYMGKMLVNPDVFNQPPADNNMPTWLHQKSLYGRLGKKNWRFNLYGGINHQVQWGSERRVYGSYYTLSRLQTLYYIMAAKAYGTANIPRSKLGNQQGSVDIGLSYDWDNILLMVYRQNFYDVGAISKLANIADGLNGMAVTNKSYGAASKKSDWKKFLVEFFYSKDQAGYPWSKPTASGDEDYYNNYYYRQGWSYRGYGMGSPLIAAAHTVKAGQAHDPVDYFISNRVVAGHAGGIGKIYGWNVLGKFTYARHYGTFGTSIYGKSTGSKRHQPYKEIFIPVSQFSALLQAERPLANQFSLGFNLAVDNGQLYNNSIGGQVLLRKTFGR